MMVHMNRKMISPWKRSKSSNYWFRLAIPPRYRARVGQTEIKNSLGTADVRVARQLCAALHSDWLIKFAAFDAEQERQSGRTGVQIVDAMFRHEASSVGSMDAVIAYELEGMALAECTYLDARTTEDILGPDAQERVELVIAETPYPAYRLPVERSLIANRHRLLERHEEASMLPGLEAAKRAFALRFWQIGSKFLRDAFEHADQPYVEGSAAFAAAGEHYLRRLIDHQNPTLAQAEISLPLPPSIAPLSQDADLITAGTSSIETPSRTSAPEVSIVSTAGLVRPRLFPISVEARTISGVFELWAAAQPPNATKLIDEWRVAIRRFVQLFGDVDVSEIDGDMVADFRDAMEKLPTRPKRLVVALPLLQQIARAETENLRRLSGPTVAKLVSGLRVTLAYACDPLRIIRINPASGVKVAKSKSEDDARLAFDHDDMRLIFTRPEIINPKSKATDAEVWLQVLAPFTGMRIEEMGKLRPGNIRCERGIWYIAVERDRAVRRRADEKAGDATKRAKTQSAYRHIPIHWLLIEAGFLAFVQARCDLNAEWLLDELESDVYGNRTKSVSRRLIRHFRNIGIKDQEKVFYSFRHTMKRECRGRPMKEEIADLLAGHSPANVGRKYGAGAELAVLKEAVDMIDYEMVEWDPVIAAMKARGARA